MKTSRHRQHEHMYLHRILHKEHMENIIILPLLKILTSLVKWRFFFSCKKKIILSAKNGKEFTKFE